MLEISGTKAVSWRLLIQHIPKANENQQQTRSWHILIWELEFNGCSYSQRITLHISAAPLLKMRRLSTPMRNMAKYVEIWRAKHSNAFLVARIYSHFSATEILKAVPCSWNEEEIDKFCNILILYIHFFKKKTLNKCCFSLVLGSHSWGQGEQGYCKRKLCAMTYGKCKDHSIISVLDLCFLTHSFTEIRSCFLVSASGQSALNFPSLLHR